MNIGGILTPYKCVPQVILKQFRNQKPYAYNRRYILFIRMLQLNVRFCRNIFVHNCTTRVLFPKLNFDDDKLPLLFMQYRFNIRLDKLLQPFNLNQTKVKVTSK